jgi:hypothetical protein
MLKDTTWKLKTSECSSVIAFENLSRIISLCGFQNAFVHFYYLMTSHWWTDASQVHYILLLNQIPWKSFTQFKSLNQVQRSMNWKDIVISSIPFSRWYEPLWIMPISLLFLSAPQVFPNFLLILIPIRFCKSDCPVWSPEMSGLYTGFQ